MARKGELWKWQDRLNKCMGDYNESIFNERELLYNGCHDVDADINDSTGPDKRANVVVNAMYEFIEGMVDSTIPDVTVDAKSGRSIELARIAENVVKCVIADLPMARINDVNERTTYIQGISLMVVNVDDTGSITIDNPHPKNFIFPKGATEIEDLDYFFILYSKTKDYIKRTYGKNVENETESYSSVRTFDTSQEGSNADEKVTLNVAWYKDADGDVGKFVWVNNTVLEDLPKYYWRRVEVCTECGQEKDDDVKACAKCGVPSVDIETCAVCGQEKFGPTCQACGSTDSEYIEPSKCVDCGHDVLVPICPVCANKTFKKTVSKTETLAFAVKTPYGEINAGGIVPYHIPKKYPVIGRINVPVNLQLEGQSDVDIVRDLQDALKKIVSTMVEKLVRGGTIILANKDHRFKLTNKLYEIVRGTPDQLGQLSVLNLSGDIVKDLTLAQYLYDKMQSVVGVTDSWLGKEDSSARTGIAKQIQVQQSGGRLNSKYLNKNDAFAQLYRVIFEFKLAFDDEGEEWVSHNIDGSAQVGEFNRYLFLKPDGRGGWEYDTNFVFRATPGIEGLPKDKNWLMAKATELLQYQAIDQEQFWTFLEAVNFPMATKIKEDWQKKLAEQRQMAQQQAANPKSANADAIVSELPVEVQAVFNSLGKEEQQSLLAEVAGGQ